MDERRRRGGLRGWWAKYAGSVAFVLLVGLTAAGFFSLQHFSTELRDGLVRACENNGNPLRAVVRKQIEYRLKTAETTDYARLFPNIPEDELRTLLRAQERELRRELELLAPVDCESLYP